MDHGCYCAPVIQTADGTSVPHTGAAMGDAKEQSAVSTVTAELRRVSAVFVDASRLTVVLMQIAMYGLEVRAFAGAVLVNGGEQETSWDSVGLC
ncbi:hypothetical protein CBR_g29706 [Chara braunii]|uniref:Uncharacterized protein n=1 Tax=Chara braunii TaxID=69332 RepID=A0A388LB67_CHABU|nr:hypothetical protein CBR_g29706 [Chara braunii]|eukprot:GBG79559.1 hypothetical protein CBR_g29706 [Chara braunii]